MRTYQESKRIYKELCLEYGRAEIERCLHLDTFHKYQVSAGEIYDIMTAPAEDWQKDC